MAAQCAHGAILAADKSPYTKEWKRRGQKKIVVYCEDLRHLLSLYKKAKEKDLPLAIVEDAGLTQVKKGTKTCLAIGPAPEKEIDEITGNLKLA